MKGWLGILSGQELSDESLQWEGRDAQLKMLFYQTIPVQLVLKILRPYPTERPVEELIGNEIPDELQELCVKPNKLSMELPNEERLYEVEAAVGAAQQVLS
ncbi:hypothetical protein BKA83DRAFT_4131936 [Pisolithus microcarpus]|nr:hypothetical protein BKA83DRAFT_4131936 [Pisolithus microcarpus]